MTGRAGDVVTRRRRNMTVEVGTNGLDSDGIEAEAEASFALGEHLLDDGVQAWRSRYRWVGPIKVMAYKEVGPPPWRWPKVGIQPNGRRFVRVIVGWRSTAYALCFLWAGRRG